MDWVVCVCVCVCWEGGLGGNFKAFVASMSDITLTQHVVYTQNVLDFKNQKTYTSKQYPLSKSSKNHVSGALLKK